MVTRGAAEKDVIKLEQKFLRLVEDARKQRAKGEQGEYSLPDIDTNYLKAVESGDMETAQRMVDDYAIKQGFDVDEEVKNKTPDHLKRTGVIC